jgi:hypothetical protein
MGAWGYTAFENDDALDWLGEIQETADLSSLVTAFDTVLDADEDYIELPEAAIAIAAAEVVAALLQRPAATLPAAVVAWVQAQLQRNTIQVDAGVVEKARRAVQRVLAESELQEVWHDSSGDGWQTSIQALLSRLAA